MCDGSVRGISFNIDTTFAAIGNKEDGIAITLD